MKIIFNPRGQFLGRGPCIEMVGQWVTPEVHEVVSRLMGDNWMDSPVYKARQKAHAFFQGGYDKPQGQWILLEFWTDQENCAEFLEILNTEVNKVIDPKLTEFHLYAKSNNDKDIEDFEIMVELIADEAKLPVIAGNEAEVHKCRAILKPENSVQHRQLHLYANYTFGIKHHIYSKSN